MRRNKLSDEIQWERTEHDSNFITGQWNQWIKKKLMKSTCAPTTMRQRADEAKRVAAIFHSSSLYEESRSSSPCWVHKAWQDMCKDTHANRTAFQWKSWGKTHRNTASDKELDHVSTQRVAVLVQKSVDIVGHLTGVMSDRKRRLQRFRTLVQRVGPVVIVALFQEGTVGGLRWKKHAPPPLVTILSQQNQTCSSKAIGHWPFITLCLLDSVEKHKRKRVFTLGKLLSSSRMWRIPTWIGEKAPGCSLPGTWMIKEGIKIT